MSNYVCIYTIYMYVYIFICKGKLKEMWFKVGIPYFTQMIWNIIFSCTCWKCSYFLPPATTKRIDYKTKQYTDFYKTCLSWWLLLWFNFKVNLIRTQSWFYISRLKIRNILVLNYLWILALFIICGVLVRSSFMTKHINTLIYVFMYVYKIQTYKHIYIYVSIYEYVHTIFTYMWLHILDLPDFESKWYIQLPFMV